MGIVEGSKAKSSLNFRTHKKPQPALFRVYSVSDHTPRNCVGKQSNNPTYPIHAYSVVIADGERVVVLDNLTTGFDWAVAPGAEPRCARPR